MDGSYSLFILNDMESSSNSFQGTLCRYEDVKHFVALTISYLVDVLCLHLILCVLKEVRLRETKMVRDIPHCLEVCLGIQALFFFSLLI